ncbi:MAG: CvpA family protein [Bacteroidetes bacterium]|nr:CvpA family protein [Bacteroidota bacterium]
MNYVDIILIIPLLWGLYKGFSKGLIIEAATLIAFGLAVWGAIKFHDFLSMWMKDSLDWTSKYLPLISFAAIFIGVLLIVFGVAKLLERFVKAVSLGFVNKLGGAIFGMLKFGLLMSMIIFFMEAINKTVSFIPDETKNNSLLYPYVQKIAPFVIPGLNESRLNKIIPNADSMKVKVKIK